MDKKNIMIYALVGCLVAVIAFLFYENRKQQEAYRQSMQRMEYALANSGGNKGKSNDPYKEVAVNNSLRKVSGAIQECYNQFLLSNPEKSDGFVEIDWNIMPDGKVKKAEFVSSDLSHQQLSPCILKVVQGTEFPVPPTGMQTYMTYKYNFKKTK